ncbi:MAG: TonB-dependent receptor [Pseudomonadota bacterium]
MSARILSLSACLAGVVAPVLANDQIIVTAERREQALGDAPASITVIGEDDLQLIDADHIAEALARAPGVNLHRGSGAEHLTAIRSPVLTGGAGAGSFLFLENGVPLRSAGFANINGLFDAHGEIAERIEIIRGPSGALYGANAIHGVVNVVTPAPTEDISLFAEIFGDTEDRYKWKGLVSTEAGGQGLLAAASVVSESGYREDAGLDQQKLTLRHTAQAGAIDLDTIFSFDNLEQETAGFIFGRADLFDRTRRRTNDFPFAFRDAKSARLQTTATIPLDTETELRVTPYARWNDMDFLQHFLPSRALEENGHWSIGAQSAVYHDAGRFSLIAGVDAEYTEGFLTEFQERETIFSFTQGLHYDYEVAAVNASGFVQGEYALSDQTAVTAAVRVDGTIYDYDNRTDDGVIGRFLRPPDQVDRFVTASPKFSIRHQFSDAVSGYVSYARGARPPQTTDLYRLQINQTGPGARPELIDAVEAGTSFSFGERIDANLVGFFMDKRNFFFRDADGFNVTNGRTRHVGVEADVAIYLLENLTLASAVTYAAHTYRFDRVTGNVLESVAFGDDVDTAPRVITNTRLLWTPADRFIFEAEWRSIGSYFTDAANENSYEGYNLLNLRAEALIVDGLSGFLTLRNATDALYAERADFAFGSERFFPGEVRTLGFGLRYRR